MQLICSYDDTTSGIPFLPEKNSIVPLNSLLFVYSLSFPCSPTERAKRSFSSAAAGLFVFLGISRDQDERAGASEQAWHRHSRDNAANFRRKPLPSVIMACQATDIYRFQLAFSVSQLPFSVSPYRDGKDGEATNTSRFRFFGGGGGGGNSSSASAIQNQNNAPATQPQRSSYDADTMSKVGQRLAAAPGAATTTTTSLPAAAMHSPGGVNHQQENPPPPQPMPKPGQWRNQQQLPPPPVPPHLHHLQQQHQVVPRPFQSPHPQQPPRMQQQQHHQPDEEAIPSDSLYGNGMSGSRADLSHWSSHGYLAKPQNNGHNPTQLNRSIDPSSGYVVLKRQPDPQPTSLPPPADPQFGEMDRKYFSVRGFSDMRNKHPDQQHSPSGNPNPAEINKYYSVDARYHSTKMQNLPPDLKLKLRQAQQQQQFPQQSGQYQYPPQPPPRNHQQQQNPQSKPMPKQSSSSSKTTSSSWLEWTQQLQAYIAWVNSQLRKRPDLKPVQDLRTDLQSGEVLAQLIEIIGELGRDGKRGEDSYCC